MAALTISREDTGNELPEGYSIRWLRESTACYWADAEGNTGQTHRWTDSKTYVRDCIAGAQHHAADAN